MGIAVRQMSASKILQAANFAAMKHTDQRRKVGDIPYINHPIGVANFLTEIGGVDDVLAIQGALLHDTVEDTDTTFEEIESIFGKEVADVVREVTDDKNLNKAERKKQQVEHAKHASYQAKLIKLCDKLYNCRDIQKQPPSFWDPVRCQGYFVWSRAVINGVRGTNKPLEDALDEVFASTFSMNGETYPSLPEGDLDKCLEEYYDSMSKKDD